MNKEALKELTGKCLRCIEEWKKENHNQPLDIEWGDYVNHCYQYGGMEIKDLYDVVFDDEEEQQNELNNLERRLLIQNVGQEKGERMYFGFRIAELRRQHEMTQQQLAQAVGISREYLVRIESGKYSVGIDILSRIAKAFNKTIDIQENVF